MTGDQASRLVQIAKAVGVEAWLSARPGQYDRLNDLAAQIVAVANEIEVEARG